MIKRSTCLLAILLVALLPPAAGSREEQIEEIEFFPPDTNFWGLRNVAAGVTSVFGLWGHWYSNLETRIETVPADSTVELFYIRANFQKNFTRVTPPVRVVLPPRIKTTAKDALTIRVAAPGFKGREVTYDVPDVPEEILVQLAPLPNALTFLGHSHLAERTTLTLRTTKEPSFRVMRKRGKPGFTLALSETAGQLDGAKPLSGGQIERVEVNQVGEDLLIKVDTRDPTIDVRSKSRYDPLRREHVFLLDLLPKGARAPGFDEIRRELDAVVLPAEDGCRTRYESLLREGIDPEVIARAHRPSGGVGDLYRREAMKRLGRADRGTVHTVSGDSLRTGNPLELELAIQSAGRVNGYLALLGAYARQQPDPALALRSLIAPELGSDSFAEVYDQAEAARASCL